MERLLRELLGEGEFVRTSRVCEAEFRVGIYLSANQSAEREQVDAVLAEFAVLDLDSVAADQFASIKASLCRWGTPIGDADALIAAICLINNETLVTRNAHHFSKVPMLQIRTY